MIKRIEFFNYVCFKGHQVIDLPEGVTLVTGTYADEPERSNQAGKTHILKAIVYGYYGFDKSMAKKETDLIYTEGGKPAEEMWVKITDENMTVKRGRTADNKAIFEIEGRGTNKEEHQEFIDRTLGQGFNDCMATSYFMQGDLYAFMDSENADQKKNLHRWIDLMMWAKYAEDVLLEDQQIIRDGLNAEEAIKGVDATLSSLAASADVPTLEAELDKRQGQADSTQKIILAKQQEIAAVPDTSVMKATIAKLQEAVDAAKRSRMGINQMMMVTQHELDSAVNRRIEIKKLATIEVDITKAQQDLTAADARAKEIQVGLEKLRGEQTTRDTAVAKINQDLMPLTQKLGGFAQEAMRLKEVIDKVAKLGSMCPFDTKPCNRVGPEFVVELKDKKAEIDKQYEEVKAQQSKLVTQRDETCKVADHAKHSIKAAEQNVRLMMNDWSIMDRKLKEFQSALDKRTMLQGQPTEESYQAKIAEITKMQTDADQHITTTQQSLDAAKVEMEKLATIDQRRTSLQQELEKADMVRRAVEGRIREIHAELGKVKENEKTKAQLAERRVKLVKFRDDAQALHEKLRFEAIALGKEIPSILMENAFEEIEGETNFVLKALKSNMSIQFQAYRELQKLEEVCQFCGTPYPARVKTCTCGFGVRTHKRRDELVLEVQQGEDIRSYDLVSGGGKALIAIAWRVAISKLLQRRRHSKIDWLLMDEIMGMLDKPNREYTVRMLFDTLMALMGFRQILVITHTEMPTSGYNVIQVTRHANYSTVGVA